MNSNLSKQTLHCAWFFKRLCLCLILVQSALFASEKKWKTDILDKGKITVKSSISERMVGKESIPLIEYTVVSTEKGDLATAINSIKEVSQHSQFLDLKKSIALKKINENTQLVYYVFNAPWPFSPTDCVAQMTEESNATHSFYSYQLTASPNLYPSQSLKRFEYYNVKYSLKSVENGKIEIQIEAQMSPPMQVPLWLIRNGFPEIAADIMRKLVKQINDTQK